MIESETAEQWGIAILGDNLGAKHHESGTTDEDGYFSRFVGPREGHTYSVWPRPEGYVRMVPLEVVLKAPVGTGKVEHVFKYRKKK